ncbi:TIGR02391 family protein [Lentzea sp. HUAS TT2]|uniref:TIGR02391 family protein n=1 Tax=Lentzea sp. HUAS TT2 TaxID=3447454 RepID=UPI003F728862
MSETAAGNGLAIKMAQSIAADIAEYGKNSSIHGSGDQEDGKKDLLSPDDQLLADFDRRILDPDLRTAARSRFVSKHYADAVEAGVKALNECVRKRSGRTEDGDSLMTVAFSANGGLLRINPGRTKSDESAQRGHMYLCQGVIGAWRNPRAHAIVDDEPARALMMLETINELITITRQAKRRRKKKGP